ncbi:MAG: response regulator [Bacteroidota bacterium]
MIRKQKRTVMVVDDEQSLLGLLDADLVARGYKVVTAASGAAALDILHKLKPSIIVLDLKMPEMNGFDFLVEARKLPNSSSVPCVILTGVDDYAAVQVGKSLGVKDYLVKPVEPGRLASTIEKMLKQSK